MAKDKVYKEGKELRVRIPEEAHTKLDKIQFVSKSRSRPEALVLALDITEDILEKKKSGSRPGIVNGKR